MKVTTSKGEKVTQEYIKQQLRESGVNICFFCEKLGTLCAECHFEVKSYVNWEIFCEKETDSTNAIGQKISKNKKGHNYHT